MKSFIGKSLKKLNFSKKKVTAKNLYSTDSEIECLNGGLYTLIQDFPGRLGYWRVGVSPSGPMDSYSFRIANAIVGNAPKAAAIEMTYNGGTFQFNKDTKIAITGAPMNAELDGKAIKYYKPINVKKGQVLTLTNIEGPGARTYLAIEGEKKYIKYNSFYFPHAIILQYRFSLYFSFFK